MLLQQSELKMNRVNICIWVRVRVRVINFFFSFFSSSLKYDCPGENNESTLRLLSIKPCASLIIKQCTFKMSIIEVL